MKTANFESSAMHSASYDPETRQLTINFNSGNPATYKDVPETIFDELKAAKSKGGYFHKSIRTAFVRL